MPDMKTHRPTSHDGVGEGDPRKHLLARRCRHDLGREMRRFPPGWCALRNGGGLCP